MLRTALALIITAVWTVSICAAIVIPTYTPPFEIHAIMGLVAGYFFGKETFRRIRGEDDK